MPIILTEEKEKANGKEEGRERASEEGRGSPVHTKHTHTLQLMERMKKTR